jgi:YD repeat-containing protein
LGSPVATCASANLHEAEIDDCLRYAEVEYDLAYAQLPLVERIAVDRIAGQSFCATTTAPFCMVETSAEWDRGFGVLQKATDPNDQVTRVAYDGLARLTAVTPPDFSDCAMTGVPVQTFQYDLVVDGLPVSRIKALQNYGSQSCSAPAYIESQSYVDGLGRARVALTRRDTSSWERSGIVVFNARGAAHLGFQNALTPGSGLSPSAALGVPAVPHTEARYDAFGRVIEALAEDGALTATFYGATSTKVCDALDMNPNSLFANTCTITRVDGHGRAYDQVLHQRRASQGYAHEYYRLVTQYRSDGAAYLMARGASESSAAIWNTTFDVERVLIRASSSTRSAGDSSATTRTAPRAIHPLRTMRWTGATCSTTWATSSRSATPAVAVRTSTTTTRGRLIGEDYVECGEAMAAGDTPMNTLPTSAIAEGEIDVGTQYVDARYYFDEEPEFTGGALTTYFSPTYWVGRATGSVDRAQASAVLYDARGQAKNAVRMMAVLPEARSLDATLPADLSGTGVATTPSAGTQSLDYSNAYFVRTVYDFLGRPTATQYPENLDWAATGRGPRR